MVKLKFNVGRGLFTYLIKKPLHTFSLTFLKVLKRLIYGQSLRGLVELGRSTCIQKKLDKRGKRFLFIKFREVRDVGELLSRMSDIWMGTFKLMGEPFNKGDIRKEKSDEALKSNKVGEARNQLGRSFKETRSFNGQ
jgi:hypothetical protein